MTSSTAYAITSMLLSATVSLAVAQTSATNETQPSTEAAPSPSTPPTHPTLRGEPTTTPDTAASGALRQKGAGSADEARQACKNVSGDAERRACMDKAAAKSDASTAASAATK